jgi:hypothetical protein
MESGEKDGGEVTPCGRSQSARLVNVILNRRLI